MDGGAAPPPASAPQGASRGGEGLSREQRLRRRAEFLRCYREGRRRGGRLATLFFVPNSQPGPRLGITVSRKVGKKAVVRQRLKRRVREIYRRWDHRSQLPAVDLVVNLKPDAAKTGFRELESELGRQLATLVAAPAGGRAS
jgi:ribonuclease P protein component